MAPALPRFVCTSLLTLGLVLGTFGCDAGAKDQERKSVIEGGKPESAAGRKLDKAKQEVDAVEKTMEREDQDRFERSAGENAPSRGVP